MIIDSALSKNEEGGLKMRLIKIHMYAWIALFFIPAFGLNAITVHDHTLVVKAVIENYDQLSKRLPPNPSFYDIVSQALSLNQIDPHTKNIMKEVLEYYPQVNEKIKSMNKEHRRIIGEISDRLNYCTNINNVIDTLQSIINTKTYKDYPEVTTAIKLAISIAKDGASTIYNPSWLPNTQITMKTSLLGFILSDIIGGIAGGITGGWVGGIVGSIAASLLYLVGHI